MINFKDELKTPTFLNQFETEQELSIDVERMKSKNIIE